MIGGADMGQLTQMMKKMKTLQDTLKNTIIRSREGGVLIDLTGELKVKDIKIEDETLLSPSQKGQLEESLKKAFEKAQTKAQQVAMDKSKEILGFDPQELLGGMGGGMPKIPGLL